MRKKAHIAAIITLLLILGGIPSSQVWAAELSFSGEFIELQIPPELPDTTSIAVDDFSAKPQYADFAMGLKAAIMYELADMSTVRFINAAIQRPKWNPTNPDSIPHINVSAKLDIAPYSFVLEYTVISGHTGGVLKHESVHLPTDGDLTGSVRYVASGILAAILQEAQPDSDSKISSEFVWNMGKLLRCTKEMLDAAKNQPQAQNSNQETDQTGSSFPAQSIIAAIDAIKNLTETNREATRKWLFKPFITDSVETAAQKYPIIRPFVEYAFGRSAKALRLAKELYQEKEIQNLLPNTKTNDLNRIIEDLVCMMTTISRATGKLEDADRFLALLHKNFKYSPCGYMEDAKRLLTRGQKAEALALLKSRLSKKSFLSKIGLGYVELLSQAGMDEKRVEELKATILASIGNRQMLAKRRAERFLKNPTQALFDMIEPSALTPAYRKKIREKLKELVLTHSWKIPENWNKPEPTFKTGIVKVSRTLESVLHTLISFIPHIEQQKTLAKIGFHVRCNGCSFFDRQTLKSPQEWIMPYIKNAAEGMFEVSWIDKNILKKVFKQPESAESMLSNIGNRVIVVDLETNASTFGAAHIPIRVSLWAKNSGTGLKLRLHTTAREPSKNIIETNMRLYLLIGLILLFLLFGAAAGIYLLKSMKDPRRKAKMLQKSGDVIGAAQLLRDAGMPIEAERILAEHFEQEGKFFDAMGHYLHANMPEETLRLFSKIPNPTREAREIAAEANMQLFRFSAARELFEETGNILGVAKTFEKEGDIETSRRIRADYFLSTGNLRSAVEELVSIQDYEYAAHVCFEAQDFRSAAVLYAHSNRLDMVEKCFQRMGKRLDIAKLKQIDVDAIFGTKE